MEGLVRGAYWGGGGGDGEFEGVWVLGDYVKGIFLFEKRNGGGGLEGGRMRDRGRCWGRGNLQCFGRWVEGTWGDLLGGGVL